MASIYKRKGSAFWWLKYQHQGRIVRESTKYRHTVIAETRKAKELMFEHSLQELKHGRPDDRSRWEGWVPDFLTARYETSPKTLERYRISWRNLRIFLTDREIYFPAQLTYTHCHDYLAWRRQGDKKLGTYAVSHNTALGELKLLHLILEEAKKRDFCDKNAADSLGIKKHKPEEKPEIPESDIQIIRNHLESEPEWMRVSFEIGLATGLRLRETNLALDQVDIKDRIFRTPTKGGKFLSAPFDETLVPLFTRLKQERGEHARCYDMPEMPSKEWWRFFKRIGMPQYCFHCLRVSFISRGARAGVPENVMMRLVNHASETIHRIYIRLRVEDADRYLHLIRVPPCPDASEP